MDPHTGRIYEQRLGPGEKPETAAQIMARGFVPLTREQEEILSRCPPEERTAKALELGLSERDVATLNKALELRAKRKVAVEKLAKRKAVHKAVAERVVKRKAQRAARKKQRR